MELTLGIGGKKKNITRIMSNKDTVYISERHETSLFHYVANRDMSESERSPECLAKEAQVLPGGGTASTARTIGFTSYYILSSPKIRARLEADLKELMVGWPDKIPTWSPLLFIFLFPSLNSNKFY
jgi:cytochrome P450